MADPEIEARLRTLEERAAHQERMLEDLNAALTAQGDRLAMLVRGLGQMAERLREAEARAADGPAPEPPPPHY